MRLLLFCVTCALLLQPQYAFSDAEAGRKLFQSTELGSNGKSCQSCHDNGKGLSGITDYDSTVLQGLINICIEDALKGKPLADDDPQLRDIELYIRSFIRQ